MQGTVVFFNPAKGWGFLRRDDGGKDLFVHHTAIQMKGYRALQADQRVSFDVITGEKGPQADKVTVIEA
jgi:CspA family cold shock protein